jgi:glutathione S-transferase
MAESLPKPGRKRYFPTMALAPKYVLYYSLRSPFARRVRIALQKLAVTYEPREIDVMNPPAELNQLNPLGLVPTMVIREPGRELVPIPDSNTILEYLHETYGQKLWPAEPAQRIKVRAASTLAVGVMTNAVAWYLENQRPNPSPEWSQEYLENIDRTLYAISQVPWRGMPWKVSDFQLTQAGYDLAIALDYLNVRMRGYEWHQRFPELARFLEIHRSRQDLAPTAPPPA